MVVPVMRQLINRAAQQEASFDHRLADAVPDATALESSYEVLLNNDARFKVVSEDIVPLLDTFIVKPDW